MYVLGAMYAYDRGVERDISQARRWLAQAVEHKIATAQPVLTNLPISPRANSHLHAAKQANPRKQQN
ncbi:MAG: SEL1-like repeat protein [Nitrospira sp.]|jgi:TPR repeat protein|nr:SEL1-like repeat protein [Nitrospira sp.]MBL8054766.1 SEL1-like repeat protein [Nitrospira sp.]